jgi:hypothetical protein
VANWKLYMHNFEVGRASLGGVLGRVPVARMVIRPVCTWLALLHKVLCLATELVHSYCHSFISVVINVQNSPEIHLGGEVLDPH